MNKNDELNSDLVPPIFLTEYKKDTDKETKEKLVNQIKEIIISDSHMNPQEDLKNSLNPKILKIHQKKPIF